MSVDPGLQFWLHYVDHGGGLAERTADGALVVLPESMATELDLPEELVVTADPDVARDDGTMLLTTGHPVLARAADTALATGDAGTLALAPPGTPAPATARLQELLRDRVTVDHGRIEVTGLPVRIDRPILRIGALVTYTVSAEECYQERLESWVDALSRLPLGQRDIARLQRSPRADGPVPAKRVDTVATALEQAHRLLDAAADRRCATLASQASDAHRRERDQARDYYADMLQSLERRRAAADPDRAELLAARIASTREERARRMMEIDEKYQAHHEIRPYRLHVVLVPGWRVPVDVCRGPRRYPFAFDWLPALGAFAAECCPHCGSTATFSAGKDRLGCLTCLPGAGAKSSRALLTSRPA